MLPDVKLKMIILRKLEIPNILRIILTYHFEYQATAHNVGVWFNATAHNVFKTGKNDFVLYSP